MEHIDDVMIDAYALYGADLPEETTCSSDDSRAADTADAIATMCELLVRQDLTGPEAQQALRDLFTDTAYQQVFGLGAKASTL